jgi:predicted PurR-regulated permease PerM
MQAEDIKIISRSNSSQRIIALGIVFAFLYWASSVVVTLLLAVLLAYFLDPVVEVLSRLRIPRAVGALFVLLAVTAILGGLGYLVVDRADHFAADWPRYSAVLRRGSTAIDRKLTIFEKQVEEIAPEQEKGRPPVRVTETPPVRDILFRGVGSLYSILIVATFLPFLAFFMLAAKPRILQVSMELFSVDRRARVQEAFDQLSAVLRNYVAGNALVALILSLASGAIFFAMHLEYPLLLGCVSGILNLVPYLGVVLSWLPPFLIGITQWKSVGPYLAVVAMLTTLHIIGLNVLMPAIVGRRVHLNALAVTISLLFWGWLWGAIGLILAIPITATIKVICDHVDGFEPVGRWLGS